MGKKILIISIIVLVLMLSVGSAFGSTSGSSLTPVEQLGKYLFFDTNLSVNKTMSCATCHAPEVGFVGPVSIVNATSVVYPGAVGTHFGNRKPPTAAYGGNSPVLHYDDAQKLWVGGMFWDGRAAGWTLGDPLAEQAQGPFLNPLEQSLPNEKLLCIRVANSDYADLFEQVWGDGSLDFNKNVDRTYEYIARSIAAYERSAEVNPFTSKYDYFLKGEAELTDQEKFGLELFQGKGKCSRCHSLQPESNGSPLFTDFTYDNLGIPKNPENPFYSMPKKWNPDGKAWIDYGLGGFLKAAGYSASIYEPELGKHKVPTLRNVDLRPSPEFVKAYGHNGYFKSLQEIVHFYNTRDVENWPEPEYATTVNKGELGNLGLTQEEEVAIVDFLKTLSDGYKPVP